MKPYALALVSILLAASPGIRAETHTFIPTVYYNTYSFAHPPALRIKPGDRVVTKTIDAAGVDWNGKSVASGGNPETGPFYIDGAEPGDMIVVTIEKLETNRATAYASSLLAPYTVTPQAIASRVDRDAKRTTWTIDKARGVARLDQVELQPGGIELPLKPMLGCIGVAPARKEAIATGVPGAFGGNMDYASMGAGVKLMLPVNEPGALLFLGDGHARQGEGEACGTGVEVAMNTVLIVDLIPGVLTPWPRLESDDYLMSVGAARPLENAYRVAQVDMTDWLAELCGVDRLDAYQIVAQAALAPVAQVCNPIYTVTSKIAKSLLPANPAYRAVHAALGEQAAVYRAEH